VIWAAYRFSHAPVDQFTTAPEKITARLFGASSATTADVHALMATLELPAPEFYSGLRELRDTNRLGTPVYMFGHIKQGGYWYFYPVGVAVKTPLAVLLLAFIGGVALAIGWYRTRTGWPRLVPLIGVLAILAVVLPTRLDIGVRHVMPVFAFLSMVGAVGAVWLWQWRPQLAAASTMPTRLVSWTGPAAVVLLSAWFISSSARAHPDYLSYFNELGGDDPVNIMVSSDVDWGQDLVRLSAYLRAQHVQHLSIAYGQIFDPAVLGLPESTLLECGQSATGWVALGEDSARGSPQCYTWIASQPIKAHVGPSLRVYYIPDPTGNGR
jgi:hypothetical protein